MSVWHAQAAGLGKLTVNSALGQPLSAEIDLVSLQPGEFEGLVGRVASPEAYADAKIEYSSVLRQLRFATERRADGRPVLKITSVGPVNEPFLDVLVEMTWPAGRLVREYPILLDPPGFNEARVAPSVATVAKPAAPAAAPLTPAAAPTPAPVAAPVPAAAPAPVAATPPIAPTGTPSARGESGGQTYGPVKQGDTLTKIANEYRADSVSLEQMLVALYRENKAAFIGENMNRLRTGQILKVPSASDASQITEKDARAEVKAQVANWNAYREQVASSAPAASAKPAPSNEATGRISVAKPEAVPAPAGKDQLKIARTDAAPTATGGAGSAGVAKLQAEIAALKEEKIARENALKEANSRVADLEKQISDMRKLMELKGLGKDGKADPKAAAKPELKAPEPAKPADTKVAVVTPPGKPGETPKPDAKPADTKPADVKPAGEPKPAEAAKSADAAKPGEAPKAADAVKPADAKPAAPKTPAKAPPPPPKPQPSFIEENMLAIGAGGGALLVGGGLIAYLARRRKKASASPGSTSLGKPSSIMPSDLKPNTTTGKTGGGLVDTGNSSFLTDFDKTGPGSIDTDEVDPVAEAEVYIAYGRDAQAEEILKEAMAKDKSRHEITVKLLEIYHQRKSIQAFDTVARELKDTIGADNPMWAKVAAMGASIDPQNALYAGSGQAYATTGAFSAAGEGIQAAKPDVDFDLGFGSTGAQPAAIDITAAATDQPAASSSSFDLDLGGAAAAAPAEASAGSLDFDLALGDSAPAPAAESSAPAAADAGFDFDLSALSMETPSEKPAAVEFEKTMAMTATAAPAPAPTAYEKTAALNLGDLSLDLGDSTPAAAASAPSDSAVSTKLELAKAYVEIGDTDGAKDILNEVAREGSPAQQAEARKLLAGL
jgi:pilus assembly protein FimV